MSTKWLMVAALVAACGDGDQGAVAVYDVPASGAIAWGQAPFPNDLFLDSSGHVEIAKLPSDAPVWEAVRATLPQHTGFCSTCAIHFPIKGVLDPATLADHVIMIDDAGARVPIDVEWDGPDSLIAVRAHRGTVLDGGKKYVVGLTDGIRGTDGRALREGSGFRSARAAAVTGPAVAALEKAGVTDNIVAATQFTVEDPAWLARDLQKRVTDYVAAHGPPVITVTKVWKASDGTLTDLMGTPAVDQAGIDNPAASSTQGPTAVSHTTTSIVIKGTFTSVRVITGSGTDLGTLKPDTTAGDAVPFILAIPSGVDVTHLPVVVFQHGAGGQLVEGLVLADLAGKAHCALLSLETYLHGERSTAATDTLHELRGDDGTLGPDGFYEHTLTSVVFHLFAVDGVPADQKASPLYILGSVSQMVADVHAELALVMGSDLSPLAAVDSSLTGLAFDRDHVFYVGASLGTVIGGVVLAADTVVSAGIFNVPLGSLVETLLENDAFRTQAELLMFSPLDVPNDTYEPDRHAIMQPSIAMFEWVVNPVEGMALAKLNASRPGRDLLWQIAGLDELAGEPSGEALVAAAGVPAVGDFTNAPVMTGAAPMMHLGAWRFAQADHFMALKQAGASKFQPPGLPPFDKRATPLMFTNPIDDVHAQATHFYDTRLTTGTAEIR
ncbi:MAG TPA: hypothetical protein VLB44_24210 [Kofleriaceae bacterium]|nr:hypothetical protein [Kofleriaceae bacterium]